MRNAADVIALPADTRAALLQARAFVSPRLGRVAQLAHDISRAQGRGHEGEADMLTRRMCAELWAR